MGEGARSGSFDYALCRFTPSGSAQDDKGWRAFQTPAIKGGGFHPEAKCLRRHRWPLLHQTGEIGGRSPCYWRSMGLNAVQNVLLADFCRASGAVHISLLFPGLTPWANFSARLRRCSCSGERGLHRRAPCAGEWNEATGSRNGGEAFREIHEFENRQKFLLTG